MGEQYQSVSAPGVKLSKYTYTLIHLNTKLVIAPPPTTLSVTDYSISDSTAEAKAFRFGTDISGGTNSRQINVM